MAFPNDPFILTINELEELLKDRVDIPEHRRKWGWGGVYDEPDLLEEFGPSTLCSTNCGPDPLLDLMDSLIDSDDALTVEEALSS